MQPKPTPDQNDVIPTAANPPASSRRDWLRRGAIAATPVVASLASAPVHAAIGDCVLPSGFISAATFASRHPGATPCVNSGPNFWLGSGDAAKAVLFLTAFSGVATKAEAGIPDLTGFTLGGMLPGSSGASEFAKYSVAAYLNAVTGASGFPPSITTALVVALYKSFRGGPTSAEATTLGSEANALLWLKTLMPG